MNQREPVVEKPYEFVLFPQGKIEQQQIAASGHHLYRHLSGQILLRLIAERPVQVASGYPEVLRTESGNEMVVVQNAAIRRRDKTVHVLPGSSLKGVVRSVVEALSLSCVRVSSWRTRRATPERLASCKEVDKLCPACRLFGMTAGRRESYLGQVQFEDGMMTAGEMATVSTPLLWAPARGGQNLPWRYLTGREAKGRKFYYHGTTAHGPDARLAADIGAEFQTRIHFWNLKPEELGLLLTALGQHPEKPFLLKIGAAKPVGMGTMSVEIVEIHLMSDIKKTGRAGADIARLQAEQLKNSVKEWIDAATKQRVLQDQALAQLWEIFKAENLSRPSPEEMY
jgi:CRISPR/Cas system CSM-associated protein Csm3 (group 7 of RAMP superfamily)